MNEKIHFKLKILFLKHLFKLRSILFKKKLKHLLVLMLILTFSNKLLKSKVLLLFK